MAADKPALVLAGMAQYRGLKSTDGRDIASIILKGDKILTDKSVIMPTEAAFKAAFETGVGNAFPDGSPQREQAYNAFKMLYAGIADQMGVRHVNEDKNATNDDVSNSAIELATGGISDYQKRKIVRPYGMDEDHFLESVNSQVQALAKANNYNFNDIEDMPLIAVPGKEGSYYLLNGNKILSDRKGKPVMVNVR